MAFVCLFRFIAFVLDSVKTGETEVRLNALRIQLDGAIQLGQRLVLFALAGQDAGHQDVAFDVVRIEIERFLRQTFRFGGEFGPAFAGGVIVVGELDAGVVIGFIELHALLSAVIISGMRCSPS